MIVRLSITIDGLMCLWLHAPIILVSTGLRLSSYSEQQVGGKLVKIKTDSFILHTPTRALAHRRNARTHTHTHTYTLTQIRNAHTYTNTHMHTHRHTHIHAHIHNRHTNTQTLSLSLTHTHTHIHSGTYLFRTV